MGTNEIIAVIDAGGRKNIGWVIVDSEGAPSRQATGSKTLDEFAKVLAKHLNEGRTVSLGIEAPLYLPIASDQDTINSARDGEGNRAWSAASGAAVTPLGVHQLAYVLKHLKNECIESPPVTFDLSSADPGLKLWEAFISGADKADSHEGDALVAIEAYRNRGDESALASEGPVINLAGAATIAAGLSTDGELVRTPCFVVRPA